MAVFYRPQHGAPLWRAVRGAFGLAGAVIRSSNPHGLPPRLEAGKRKFEPLSRSTAMSKTPVNPYCAAARWPEDSFKDPITARLSSVSYAACTLFLLLKADERLACDLEDFDPEESPKPPPPFDPFFREGLMEALGICKRGAKHEPRNHPV
jgi:hypothetical protein